MAKLGFYGCGNMGGAILRNILKKNIFRNSEILVVNRTKEKSEILKKELGIQISQDPLDLKKCDYIVLGFKPQNLSSISIFNDEKIIISILAGVSIEILKRFFPKSKIVRTMPNLPIRYGTGMTAIFFDKEAEFLLQEKKLIRNFFDSGGKSLELETEDKINNFTALCGSSPAYFLYFAEKLMKEAMENGFDKKEARIMTKQILLGTSDMVLHAEDGIGFEDLRNQITSEKGVTEKAIEAFKENEKDLMKKIIEAGITRSCELEKEIDNL